MWLSLTLSRCDMIVCFISCLLKPLRLSLKLPRFYSCCGTLKWSPAVLDDITKPPRICVVCSARGSSCCSYQTSSFPWHGRPLQLQQHLVQGTQPQLPASPSGSSGSPTVPASLSPTLMRICFSL